MIRHNCALVALVVLALSSVACVAEPPSETQEAADTSQDLARSSARFETFQGTDGEYYFRLVASNGEHLLRSEAYPTKDVAKQGIEAVVSVGVDARQYELLNTTDGKFYFNLKGTNGEVIGTSDLYTTKTNAERAERTVRALIRAVREEMRNHG